ncbi:hypothetical protein BGX26_009202, partial [Mortierella sp. AD094]
QSKLDTFVIMKLNVDKKKGNLSSSSSPKFKYHAIRRQKSSIATTVNKFRNCYPDAEEIVNIDYNPNAIVMFNVVKQRLSEYMDVSRNDFNIKGISEPDFIKRVNAI